MHNTNFAAHTRLEALLAQLEYILLIVRASKTARIFLLLCATEWPSPKLELMEPEKRFQDIEFLYLLVCIL
jgi:hypothetical protein